MTNIKVIKVIDENTVLINKGSDDGIKKGQNFLIYGVGEEIFDPDTKESLGRLELVRGTGTPSHIQTKMTQLKSDQYEEVGAKTIRKSPSGVFALAGVVEEIVNPESVPIAFDSPEVGDSVRRIS